MSLTAHINNNEQTVVYLFVSHKVEWQYCQVLNIDYEGRFRIEENNIFHNHVYPDNSTFK